MPCRRAWTQNPDAMRTRRETVEHPFGTLKMRMGATHLSFPRLRGFLTATMVNIAHASWDMPRVAFTTIGRRIF
jgi:hypothetical protein